MRYHGETRYRPPPSHRIAYVRAEVEFSTEFGNYSRRYERDGRDLLVITDVTLPRTTIDTPRLEAFNRFIEQVRWNGLITFDVEAIEGS